MRTIQRAETGRISIRECKQLILGSAPLMSVGELHATMDEITGRLLGPIEHRVIEGVNAFERDIHDEFFLILQQLNIKPRHIFSPSDTNYRNTVGTLSCYDVPELPASPGVDRSYAVSHDEFVRIADAFGAQVVVAEAQVSAGSAGNAPVVPFKKSALVAAHVHEWPTIERDISDAKANGLATAAKAGKRGWREADALTWARAKGKLISAAKPADSMTQAMHSLGKLPTRKHTMQG